MFDVFDVFDSFLIGQEIEYDGKTYLRLTTLKDGLVIAVEKDAELPAQVVVIKPKNTKLNQPTLKESEK